MDEITTAPGHPGSQTRVLIVDADPEARDALSDAVTRLGHKVCHVAEPGQSVLDLPSGRVPGLALIGLGADEASDPAIETAGQVVARYGVPVVYATETTDAALLRAGAHGYALKPSDRLDAPRPGSRHAEGRLPRGPLLPARRLSH